ncbi:golgin subfamily A member 1 isoform X2 [Petromyzon marinus]|uniref:golgin subfamily A member 1 isoform X2 n=1 Tax=Petromyzon marinus TaxID=7757 RepID=UPI003F6E5626
MFAKLKKKISEEEGGGVVRGLPGPGLAGRLPRTLSRESLASTGADSGDDASLDGSASREELLVLLSRRTDQIRKLEAKLGECAEQLRNTARLKEKLEAALERQQDSSMRKMQELNESYQAKRSKMAENATLALEKNNKEWTEKLAAMEKERRELALRLAEFEERSADFFQRRDERDELTELQQQETAKLLRKEEESRCLSEEVACARQEVAALEAQLERAQEELSALRANGAALKSDNSYLRRELEEERQRGEQQESELSLQNQRLSHELAQARFALQELQEEHKALRVETESLGQQAQQAARETEQRCAMIGRLTEKATSLERRIAGDLTMDQHTQELLLERARLEERLEELSTRLSESQAVATATTSGLEQQVRELRDRARELEAAAQAKEEERAGKTRARDEELRRLHEDLTATKEELKRAQRVATTRESERDQVRAEGEAERRRLQQQWAASRQQLGERVAALDAQLSALETARDFDRTASQHSLGQLQAEGEELRERVAEQEATARTLEEELHSTQAELTAQRAALAQSISDLEMTRRCGDTLQKQLCELQEALALAEGRLAEAQERCTSTEARSYVLEQELRASEALAEERQRASEEEVEEGEAAQPAQAGPLGTHGARNGTREGPGGGSDDGGDDGATAAAVITVAAISGTAEEEGANSVLRMELAEKHKTIKQLQQRLAELKKTLQRELRLRVEGSDSGNAAAGVVDGRERPFGASHSLMAPHEPPDWLRGGGVLGGAVGGGLGGGGAGFGPYATGAAGEPPRVNLQYLKHVVLKFVSAREAEAFHLVRAISVLLHLSSQEERLLKETLEYKMSWFGTRPAPQGAVRPSITGSGLPWQ